MEALGWKWGRARQFGFGFWVALACEAFEVFAAGGFEAAFPFCPVQRELRLGESDYAVGEAFVKLPTSLEASATASAMC